MSCEAMGHIAGVIAITAVCATIVGIFWAFAWTDVRKAEINSRRGKDG